MKKSAIKKLSSKLPLIIIVLLLTAPGVHAAQQYQGLCSYVKIQILQELTLERIGFLATLEVTNNEGDGSITDFVCRLKRPVTVEEINVLMKNVAGNELRGVLQYMEDPIVGVDIIGNRHSSIFDAALTKVMPSGMVKVVSWYDNEFGYSNRMLDLVKLMGKA